MNATFAPFRPVRGQIGFASQSGALGIELLGQAASLGLGVSTLRVDGQQGRRQRQRPPPVLGSRPRDQGDPPVPRVVREPAQVRAARPSRRSQQADPRGEERPQPRRDARRGVAHRGARILGCRDRRAVPSGRASSAWTRSRSCSTPRRCSCTSRCPPGRRVAIVSNGGGPGILASDACEGAGLEVPVLSDATQAELRSFVSPDASTDEPGRPDRLRDRGDLRARAADRARGSRTSTRCS